MVEHIILRFDRDDALFLKIDEVTKKLKASRSGITRTALWEFCQKILNENGCSNTQAE